MIRFTAAALLLTTTIAVAQPTERRFDVGRFDAVELASADGVRITRGDRFSIMADGDPRAVAALDIGVRGDTLRIDRRSGSDVRGVAIVTIVMPVLKAAAISGSGSIRATAVAGDAVTGRISGSGTITLAGLAARNVRLDLSGSGSIVADGSADRVTADLSGSGQIDARRLTAPALLANLGGSGQINATASRTADVSAGGSGSVRIDGGARCAIHRSGTASVRCG